MIYKFLVPGAGFEPANSDPRQDYGLWSLMRRFLINQAFGEKGRMYKLDVKAKKTNTLIKITFLSINQFPAPL